MTMMTVSIDYSAREFISRAPCTRSNQAMPEPRPAPSRSAASGDNRKEIRGFQAGAANQSTVHTRERHDFGGVGRLDRAAVEDADLLRLLAKAFGQPPPDMGMGRPDVIQRRREAGADGPDGFIGDDEV